MYRNVVTEMSPDRNGQIETAQTKTAHTDTARTETARPKSPVPRKEYLSTICATLLQMLKTSQLLLIADVSDKFIFFVFNNNTVLCVDLKSYAGF